MKNYPKSERQKLRDFKPSARQRASSAAMRDSEGGGGGGGIVRDALEIPERMAGLEKKDCWNCGKRMPRYYTKCPECHEDV